MQNKKFVHVGCYVRVSTENQIENYSIEEQTERLEAYCSAKDWTIYKIYTDGGYSGGSTNRPALQQMLQDVQFGRLDMIAVYKLDRLSRSQKDTLTLIEDEFIAHDVEFVSMSENFDTSTPFGRAMIGILSVFAQLEKDQITERFTMGRIGRSKAGYYHGGPTPPTGYKYIDGNLIVDPYRAPQVQEVFKKFLNGYSINAIQKYMHEKYGGWNNHSLIINILRNSVYIGKVKFKKKEYDGMQQPVISTGTFNRVQELLNSPAREDNKTSSQKTPFRAGFLLSSMVYCSKCGARYSANHGYYKCYSRAKSNAKYTKDPNCMNRNWKIDELDALVIGELEKLKYNSEYLKEILKSDTQNKSQIGTAAVSARIKEVDTQMNRMIGLYQVGSIPMNQIFGRIENLQKEKDALQVQLADQPSGGANDSRRMMDSLNLFEGIFSKGAVEEKRIFVSSIIDSIWVDEDNIRIKWRI
nr:recombinase family protein [uncultured Caproiciproducens sp.]